MGLTQMSINEVLTCHSGRPAFGSDFARRAECTEGLFRQHKDTTTEVSFSLGPRQVAFRYDA